MGLWMILGLRQRLFDILLLVWVEKFILKNVWVLIKFDFFSKTLVFVDICGWNCYFKVFSTFPQSFKIKRSWKFGLEIHYGKTNTSVSITSKQRHACGELNSEIIFQIIEKNCVKIRKIVVAQFVDEVFLKTNVSVNKEVF